MMTRNTPSETNLLPENNDPITTVHSTIEVSKRRRKTFALEDGLAAAVKVPSGMLDLRFTIYAPHARLAVLIRSVPTIVNRKSRVVNLRLRRSAGADGRIPPARQRTVVCENRAKASVSRRIRSRNSARAKSC